MFQICMSLIHVFSRNFLRRSADTWFGNTGLPTLRLWNRRSLADRDKQFISSRKRSDWLCRRTNPPIPKASGMLSLRVKQPRCETEYPPSAGVGNKQKWSARPVCVYSACTGSEESASLGLPQDIRFIGQKIVQRKATNVSPVGGSKPPEGNHTKILHINSHTCVLIRIRTLEVKEEETIMEKTRFSGGRWQCKTVHCWRTEDITEDMGITNQYTSKNYQK